MSKVAEALQAEILRLARKEIKRNSANVAQSIHALKRSLAKVLQGIAALDKKLDKQIAALKTNRIEEAESAGQLERKARLSPQLLKKLRKRLKISQTELAQLVSVSQPAVATWEQGRAKPRGATRDAIIALRELSPAEARAKLAATKAKS